MIIVVPTLVVQELMKYKFEICCFEFVFAWEEQLMKLEKSRLKEYESVLLCLPILLCFGGILLRIANNFNSMFYECMPPDVSRVC